MRFCPALLSAAAIAVCGLIATGLLSSCSLAPVPLEGLECPCAAGWTCDPGTGTCVQGEGGICGRPGAEPGAVTISDVTPEWTTLNQMRLTWATAGSDELFEYEIDIAESDLALARGDVLRTITSADNPELGRAFLPGTSGDDPVLASTVRDLEGDARYAARLVAIDSRGDVSCSETISFTTNPALRNGGLALANESLEGIVLPTCFPLRMDASRAAEGDAYFEYQSYCDTDVGAVCDEPAMTAPTCWQNLRIQDINVPVSDMGEGDLRLAYYEVDVAIENSENGYYADLGIQLEAGFFIIGSQTLVADGEYHTYQIPLSALRGADGAPARIGLDEMSGGIRGFRVGTSWAHGATVRIDNAAIRW